MKSRIQSIHFDADSKLLELIEEKLDKFTQTFGQEPVDAKVILRLEKTNKVQDKIVELIVTLPGNQLVAKSTSKSFEEALKSSLDSLKAQWIKSKEKLQSKHG